jgi:hypothetical protein
VHVRSALSPFIGWFGVGLLMLWATEMRAQGVGWSAIAEASGTVLFGNSSERIAASRIQLARADSTLEVRADARVRYAEVQADSSTHVSRRAWLSSLALDYRPFDQVSAFGFGSVESSLQLGIARRSSAGFGAKYTFVRDEEREASVSLALLLERTRARPLPPLPGEATTRERWSLRVRGRRDFGGISVSHLTFYQPLVAESARFTVNTTTTIGISLTGSVAFTATLEDEYDSDARSRGAHHNNDGQLMFGIKTSF